VIDSSIGPVTTCTDPTCAEPTSRDPSASADALRLALTQQQLRDAQLRLAEMEQLLRELPDIFERKYQQRLQPLREQQERLIGDNQQLQQQLRQLSSARANPLARLRQLPPPRLWFKWAQISAGWRPRGGWADPTRR
jgi:C4-dicarboxylate-specific signal transduction histidine kinase